MSFATGSSGVSTTHDAVNAADFDSGGPWGPDSANRTFTYASSFNSTNNAATQVCTAGRRLFSTDRRKFEMDLKGTTTYSVSSGWKVWNRKGDLAPTKGADGDPFEVTVLETAFAISRMGTTLLGAAALILLYSI